ncbi:MAG: hypothetical protein PF450_15345 [Bacteroidales bacterium]|nr:hypothetical protein [Bacteroidales bacterium]
MKNNIWVLPILTMLLVTGCEYKSYEEHEIDPYDGILTFTEVNKKADWKNRYEHASVAFDGKIWVLGGYNPGEVRNDTYYEDVWSSEDGINWELVTEDAPWKGRKGHAVVAFDDGNGEAMYLIGGFSVDESTGYRQYNNDVWKSSDGISWSELKTTTHNVIDTINNYPLLDSTDMFYPRMDHAAVVANHGGQDYIYVIGGRSQLVNSNYRQNQRYFNDVWRSTNGINWEKLENNDYGIRAGHAAAVDPRDGTIYIQGGMHGISYDAPPGNDSHPIKDFTHLWSSIDGINWTSEYDTAFICSNLDRVDHSMVFYEGAIWTFPGRSNSTMHYTFNNTGQHQVWRVDLGIENTWIEETGTDMPARHSYSTVLFNDKIWFMGGVTTDMGQDNDVWAAEL